MSGAGNFLGFDFSTQQIKAVVTGEDLQTLHEVTVRFDEDLPRYKTENGVITDGLRVTSPVLMWVEALDLILSKLSKLPQFNFGAIAALSGAGQQHGSVYWAKGSRDRLRNLDSTLCLADQLKNAFALEKSPIWMDSSTEEECRMLEKALGGAKELARITGNRAYHRFTGNQIAKIAKDIPEIYRSTERVSLVSSFACSLFIGDYAAIDYADGSGMNLLDISTHKWDKACLSACGEDLEAKLGQPIPAHSIQGNVSEYWVKRYGFSPDCKVVSFTGDNPASMVGMVPQPGDVMISLGTSDTVLVWLEKAEPGLEMHVLCNPVKEDAYMGMLCFKNGALTRNRVRDSVGCKDWAEFSNLIASTQAGNSRNIGFYFDLPEILPGGALGTHRFGPKGEKVERFSKEVEARAVIESQSLAKRIYAEKLGWERKGRVLVTGGGSANQAILQVLADVFNQEVWTQTSPNSAALGSAFRAKHGLSKVSLSELCKGVVKYSRGASPRLSAVKEYEELVEIYVKLEQDVLRK